jgi:hypothetical protein
MYVIDDENQATFKYRFAKTAQKDWIRSRIRSWIRNDFLRTDPTGPESPVPTRVESTTLNTCDISKAAVGFPLCVGNKRLNLGVL